MSLERAEAMVAKLAFLDDLPSEPQHCPGETIINADDQVRTSLIHLITLPNRKYQQEALAQIDTLRQLVEGYSIHFEDKQQLVENINTEKPV